MIAPEWVAVSGFGRRRSLSDLAVWGFPEFSRKIFPLKPFSTLFLPFDPSFNSFTPQNPLSTSLDRTFLPFLPLPPFFPSFKPLLNLLQIFLGPYWSSSEHLRNPSLMPPKAPKDPKRPFLGLFRGFPPKPPKRAKIPLFRPFLTPFSPLPYPL